MSGEPRQDGSSPLIQPPQLQTTEERTASRLELFFDLAYVLVLARLAEAFGKDLTWHGATVFVGLFVVTWWSWVTTTLYANRFDTNDVLYRLAKLATAFAVVIMAASATEAVGAHPNLFALGYLATRVVLLLLYVRAYRHVAEARDTVKVYLGGTGAGAVLWTVSLAVPAPARYVLWAVGILVEAVAPLVATHYGRDVPLHPEHLPERFGLFVILVLGESIASVVKGVYEAEWRGPSVAVAGIGFVLAAALWWNYFDLGAAAAKERLVASGGEQGSGAADYYVYGHLPLTLGLAAVGVGIKEYVTHPVGELSAGGRSVLCVGALLFLVGTSVIVAGPSRQWRAAWPWPMAAIPAVLIVGFLDALVPIISITMVSVAFVVTVLAGIRAQRRGSIETMET